MDSFTHKNLMQLVRPGDDTKVSLYMPTVRAGREVQQNAVRFKNLIQRARQTLDGNSDDALRLGERIDEASALVADDDWWQHQSDGLAMFLADDRTEIYRLPFNFAELVTVAPQFYVTPLVRFLQGDGQFYVLAVSQNSVRLFQGSHYRIKELQPDELPADLRSALNIDEYTSSLQQHSTGGSRAAGGMTFHGQGAADLDVKKEDEIKQYFHVINRALSKYFENERVPLVFAGVDYLFPIFRATCKYKGIVEQPLAGNPDDVPAEELRSAAWRIVEPMFLRDRESALTQFNRFVANDKTTTDLNRIVRAAQVGAIETLLLADEEQLWGSIDNPGAAVAIEGENDAEELLNDSAVQTLATGGNVYMLPKRRMPDEQPLAALLRFQVD
jgi:Bacterial archaeo-eukaryotic release factor family 7